MPYVPSKKMKGHMDKFNEAYQEYKKIAKYAPKTKYLQMAEQDMEYLRDLR